MLPLRQRLQQLGQKQPFSQILLSIDANSLG
jgi:hypothetical protein